MCMQIIQSKPTEFSKNGEFYSKAVVIIFSNCLNSRHNRGSVMMLKRLQF